MTFLKRLQYLFLILLSINSSYVYCQNNKIDSLIAEVKGNTPDTNQVNNLYTVTRYFIYREPDKALEYNNMAIEMANKIGFIKGKARALDISGIYYQNKGDFEIAENFYTNALELRKELKDPKLIAVSYNNFGVLNRKKGDFDKSKEFFLKSMEISLEHRDSAALSRVYNNLGLVSENQGKYEASIEYHLKSLELREKIGNKEDIASSLNNIGILFLAIEKYNDALDYLTRSLKIKETLGNNNSLASTYTNIGTAYYYLNDLNKALEFQTKSKAIYENIGDKKNLGVTLSNMSYIAMQKNDLQLALKYSLESIKIIEEIGSVDQLSDSYSAASSIFHKLKQFDLAKKYALNAYQIATKNNLLPSQKSALNTLYLISISLNDYKQAIEYLKQYNAVKDTLFNETNNKQILELEAKYETVKKEKEIALLSEKSVQQELSIEKREKTITSLIALFLLIAVSSVLFVRQYQIKQKQKALLLEQQLLRSQMNPHFIFNALGAIQNQVLQKPAIEAVTYIASFAKLMRSILDGSRGEMITMETEIETLTEYLTLQKLRLKDKLQYSINVDIPYSTNEIAIPPMLLQPFIENAVEHGIAKKDIPEGTINITFKTNGERMSITIEDDGIGLKHNPESTSTKHESLASKITYERMLALTKTHKKNFHYTISGRKSDDGTIAGTKVILEIPLLFYDK
ncbi:MAG TPA: hypothetical protein DIW31_06870 [Bacteroidales bacterium]|nr:hypothetical protein [Bacteroidales bacterium]